MSDLTFKIIELVMGLIIIGVGYLFIYLKNNNQKFADFVDWVEKAVKAAEKIFPEAKSGAKKKEYVIEFVNTVAEKIGVTITEEQIDILIEAAVEDLNLLKNDN